MGRPRKWNDPEKKQQTLLFNKTVLNKLKAYAVETDQSFDDVIKTAKENFDAELLALSHQIDAIRQQALQTIIQPPIEEPLVE